MKKWMAALFFALLLLPNALGLILPKAEEKNTENRVLAELPELSLETLGSYPKAVEAYLNDHAPLRSQFLDLYAAFNMEVFHSADSREVILGKDGWMFYTDGATRTDALGILPFTEEQHQVILNGLLTLREQCVEDPDQFVLFIAPNKETIYSQYLPDAYAPVTDTSRARELVKYIRAHSDLKVLYPVEALQEAAALQPVYYKSDTHWNNLGAFIGLQELLKAVDGPLMDWRQLTVTEAPGWCGDLGNQWHMPEQYLDDTELILEGYYDDALLESSEKLAEAVTRYRNAGVPDSRSLTIVRDSFGNALDPLLNRTFQDVTSINWDPFGFGDLPPYKNEIFVYERVERNLEMLYWDMNRMNEKRN